jgi:hypothetical protein
LVRALRAAGYTVRAVNLLQAARYRERLRGPASVIAMMVSSVW